VDIYLEHAEQRRVMLRDAPHEARSFPYKINDLYLFSQAVWDLALDENVVDALRAVLGGDPTIVTSLYFERGSEQRFHTDTLYMPGIMEGSMTAAWFALEDVDSDSGPLVYYPGSHKIPRFLFSNKLSYQIGAEMSNYDDYMAKNIAEHGLKPVEFLPKAGDVLIWHEHLYHGGKRIENSAKTRNSVVVHYWRADLLPYDQIRRCGNGYILDRAPLL